MPWLELWIEVGCLQTVQERGVLATVHPFVLGNRADDTGKMGIHRVILRNLCLILDVFFGLLFNWHAVCATLLSYIHDCGYNGWQGQQISKRSCGERLGWPAGMCTWDINYVFYGHSTR